MGAVVVVTTSTLNRIMVVELALPALIPGFVVGFHYLVQLVRPRMGFGADQGRRCTPWMLGGMAVLALGGFLASLATVWSGVEPRNCLIRLCIHVDWIWCQRMRHFVVGFDV
jgi:BCD family chlorophyll transporter-like MFS transporter